MVGTGGWIVVAVAAVVCLGSPISRLEEGPGAGDGAEVGAGGPRVELFSTLPEDPIQPFRDTQHP